MAAAKLKEPKTEDEPDATPPPQKRVPAEGSAVATDAPTAKPKAKATPKKVVAPTESGEATAQKHRRASDNAPPTAATLALGLSANIGRGRQKGLSMLEVAALAFRRRPLPSEQNLRRWASEAWRESVSAPIPPTPRRQEFLAQAEAAMRSPPDALRVALHAAYDGRFDAGDFCAEEAVRCALRLPPSEVEADLKVLLGP